MTTTKILSIDGGGIRGIIPLKVLEYIETETKQPIHKLFNYMGGTSTGGIIALGLNCKVPKTEQIYTAKEVLHFYTQEADKIFVKNHANLDPRTWVGKWGKSQYTAEGIEGYLKTKFGADTMMKDLQTGPYVSVYAYDLESNQPRYFDNQYDYRTYVWEAARATSAAPTYFPAAKLRTRNSDGTEDIGLFIDGGVYINNPALNLLIEARRDPSEQEILVSLGTGDYRKSQVDKENSGNIGWAQAIVNVSMTGVSSEIDLALTNLLMSRQFGSKYQYYRLQKEFNYDVEMDDISRENIKKLEEMGAELVKEKKQELDKLCHELTK
jgi:patatin-like phospholipase/acyl hydrolase